VRASLLFLGLLALPAGAASADPPPVVHRIQAGTLDPSGWTDAASTEGGFATRLPCLFNDFSIPDPDPQSPMLSTFAVGCERPDGSKFSVWRFRYRGGAAAAQALFERTRRAGGGMPGAAVTAVTYAGATGIEMVGRLNNNCAWERMIRMDTDNVILIVEGPAALCDTLAPMASRFFAALNLRPGTTAAAGAGGHR
jgi:hypothetical protein